ncbi:MAG: proline racemase family protein, partial [Salinivirgaceae bacterium]
LDNWSRNVCVFASGQVDRSPTGTGISARAALHYAKGQEPGTTGTDPVQNQSAPATDTVNESAQTPDTTSDTTDQSKLDSIWQQIIKSLENDGPRINAAIQIADPKWMNPTQVQINISAEIQKELYQKFEQKIIQVLRNELNNKSLEFIYQIVITEAETNRPLTPAEQFKEMSAKNPALELLREKFDLDLKN